MLLLIDAGNTRIKWALAASTASGCGDWISTGSVVKEQVAHLAEAWRALDITRVVASNVAGPAVRDSIEQALRERDATLVPEWQASQPALAGIRNGYRQPTQLGVDRFLSAIGARALFPDAALLIATCGTATTIDAVTADGLFRGGLILPGLNLMAAALARNTAQLPQVMLEEEHLPRFADNTEEAIIAGCMAAQAGAIERSFTAFVEEYGAEQALCLISGGAGAQVAAHLAIPHRHVDNLVLPGLEMVATLTTP